VAPPPCPGTSSVVPNNLLEQGRRASTKGRFSWRLALWLPRSPRLLSVTAVKAESRASILRFSRRPCERFVPPLHGLSLPERGDVRHLKCQGGRAFSKTVANSFQFGKLERGQSLALSRQHRPGGISRGGSRAGCPSSSKWWVFRFGV